MVGDILQPTHLLFVLIVALVVLGPKRLPEVGRSLGRGLRDFKVAISGEEEGHTETLPGHATSEEPVAYHAAPEGPAPGHVTSDGPLPGSSTTDETPPAPPPASPTG